MKMKLNIFNITSALLVFNTLAFAGTTGRITGKVIDAFTKEPLSGAVILIQGTSLGANTDLYGRYCIVNVPLGTYLLRAKMMGYADKCVTGVKSVMDSTTKIADIEMGFYEVHQVKSLEVNTNQLKRTYITSHLNATIEQNTNLIYCATFQIAWNGLQNNFIKEPIIIEGNPADVEQLNKQEVTQKYLDDDSYVAIADTLSVDLLNRINKELKNKFSKDAPPEVSEQIDPYSLSIFSYCYLFKNVQFPNKYIRSADPLPFIVGDENISVPNFGVSRVNNVNKRESYYDSLRKQVEVLYYLNDDDFAIKLKTLSKNDELILVKMNPKISLFATIKAFNDNRKRNKITVMNKEEELLMPYIDFDINHTYTQFANRKLLNKDWNKWVIKEAIQKIRFKLSESGAILVSEARFCIVTGTRAEAKRIRKFIFNKPFLVMMRKKGCKLPYFAMWVGNAELLGKY